MGNLHNLETNVLMEMLVKQTAELTAKITGRNPRSDDEYEYDLSMIQAELNSRLQPKDDTTISDMSIEVNTGTSSSDPTSAITEPGSENIEPTRQIM